MIEVMTAAIRRSLQSSSQIVTTNKPTPNFFYRFCVLPITQPTVSELWRRSFDNKSLFIV